MTLQCDLLVIGAGPAGYTAALRAARLGLKVICADERDEPGGVCLNAGCIPSKTLIAAAELLVRLRGNPMGIRGVENLAVDLDSLRARKEKVVQGMVRGIRLLFKKAGVDYRPARAVLQGPGEARLEGPEGTTVRFKHCLLAVGSRPIELPGLPFDGRRILSSRDFLRLEELPARLLVLGGGYIGLELAFVARALGAEVSVVEMQDQVLPGMEPEVVRIVARSYRKMGIRLLPGHRALGPTEGPEDFGLRVESVKGEQTLQADTCLVALGRRPDATGLGLGEAGVVVDERGFIPAGPDGRTNVPSILAAGDIVGQPMLAHKGYYQGKRAAETAAGLETAPMGPVPAVVFTHPEVASVGLTETEAREQGRSVVTGTQRFAGLGRAMAHGEIDGFVKLVAEEGSGTLLGAQIVGPAATDLIGEAALAVQNGITLEQLLRTIHPHPTFCEGILEAAEAAAGVSVHHG